MEVNQVQPCAVGHLSRTGSDWVDMSPPALRVFKVGLSGILDVVTVVVCLAVGPMIVYMELGDDALCMLENRLVNLHMSRKLTHTPLDVH